MDGKEGLTNLAGRVRNALADDPRAGDELRLARAGFLDQVERRNVAARRPRASGRRWLPLAFAASIAGGAAGLWLWTRPGTFQIGETRQGKLGDLIEASDGAVVPVSFSEGSTLAVHDGGRIRVLSVEAGATSVLLEDGIVDATIAHRRTGRTKWEFEAGAYRVTVNGTKFRMAYQAAADALWVSTEEGRVTVAGGCLEAPRMVSAGESLAPTCAPREAPPPNDPGTKVEPTAADSPPVALPRPPSAAKVAHVGRWRELLAAGRLLEGLRAAESAHFDLVCGTATPKELLALADAGRFFGPSKRAVAALAALRRRFPGSADAGTAAFTLGRLVFEKDRDYAQAARWFEIYLHEQPDGPLMGDAFGRLMEARFRSGDDPGARTSAQQYLRRFPEGPYASEARGILSR